MPHKVCKKCGEKCGVRSYVCKACQSPFGNSQPKAEVELTIKPTAKPLKKSGKAPLTLAEIAQIKERKDAKRREREEREIWLIQGWNELPIGTIIKVSCGSIFQAFGEAGECKTYSMGWETTGKIKSREPNGLMIYSEKEGLIFVYFGPTAHNKETGVDRIPHKYQVVNNLGDK